MRLPDGSDYEGEWGAGVIEGHGTYTHFSGATYVGQWKHGRMDGYGTHTLADGDVQLGTYRQGAMMGEGVKFTADKQKAWRLHDGKNKGEISLEEAHTLEVRLTPPPHVPKEAQQDNMKSSEWEKAQNGSQYPVSYLAQ